MGRQKAMYRETGFQVFEGYVSKHNSINFISPYDGQILGAGLLPGKQFKEGDLLCHIADKEVLGELRRLKRGMIQRLPQVISSLMLEEPKSAEAWSDYLSKLKINGDMPQPPAPQNKGEEKTLFKHRIYRDYYAIDQLQRTVKDHPIYAPFDGIVKNIASDNTEIYSGQHLMTLWRSHNTFELETQLSVSFGQSVNEGDSVNVSLAANPDKVWSGYVCTIKAPEDFRVEQYKVTVGVNISDPKSGLPSEGEKASVVIFPAVSTKRR
ncbi:hypothetical protein FUAX_48700 (plasmid) [Fulvitalea axinellae]|uniref:Uncharacterized protein n=1 Tax=Fulvitalea axinellae TaxID=1182444 RepID=A0AAU9CWU0_9BACT|nr:hypothetical protein FUAX_48700 [Fulvitalea axinellae]